MKRPMGRRVAWKGILLLSPTWLFWFLSSMPFRGKLFKMKLFVVGTFGQPDTWDIYDSDTFQHPMVPYDVLVDPLSLPSHPVIQERENILDILYAEPGGSSAMNESDREQVIAVMYRPRHFRPKIKDWGQYGSGHDICWWTNGCTI